LDREGGKKTTLEVRDSQKNPERLRREAEKKDQVGKKAS